MPDPNASLRALMGMQSLSNADTSRSALRQTQLQDPRNPRSFRSLVGMEDAEDEAAFEADPNIQQSRGVGAGLAEAHIANQPEIRANRDRMLDEAERIKTGPARVAGMFNLEAARAGAQERDARFDEQQRALDLRQARTQDATAGRQANTQQQINNRQRVTGLQSGKINAATPQPNGMMQRLQSMLGMGQFDQGTANQAEIDQLQGAGGAEDEPQIGDRAEAEDGTPLEYDGIGWAVIGS